MRVPRIILGGVPFGCDNIGDEAILASVVGIIRRVVPGAAISVCTGKREETERKLGVETLPLYGFDPRLSAGNFAEGCAGGDVYIWAGATGLSDYPDMACSLLEIAHAQGKPCIVWCVGMNSVLNPAFYSLGGYRRMICDRLFRYGIDLRSFWEERLRRRVRRRIDGALKRCHLVVLRDEDSLEELRRCGTFPGAIAAADSALLQRGCSDAELPWRTPEDKARFFGAEKRLGLCISAQSAVREPEKLAAFLDDLHLRHPELLTVMIPMNPRTDFHWMLDLRKTMSSGERVLLLRFTEPEEVQTLCGHLDLVISSRLHLMILALNRGVPCIGVARGSKINTFLDAFGLPSAGDTEQIDFARLSDAVEKYLTDDTFREHAATVRKSMLERLALAEKLLGDALNNIIG